MASTENKRFKLVLRLLASVLISQAGVHTANAARPLTEQVPAAAKNVTPVGVLNPNAVLNLSIGLPVRNPENLTKLLEQIYDPSSPKYREYLTPDQFAQQFGASSDDYQKLIAFAQTNGFAITELHSNRLVLTVSAKVKDVERAFHTSLRTFKHPTENRDFYAPQIEPQLDLDVPVLHITGLDDFSLPKPLHVKRSAKGTTAAEPNAGTQPQRGTGPSGSYIGKDFRAAYAPGVALNGAGQIVGLIQFDGYYASDISQYTSLAGLAAVPLQNVLLDGFNGAPGVNNDEVALDIEMALSMAPGLSKIIIYEAGPNGSGNDMLSRIASDNAAKQVSASWTFGTDATTSQLFQQLAAQGISYFNASGDDDAYTNTVSHPADNPYVTSVGGTTLTTTSGAVWSSETAWNWGGNTGTGGGISTSYGIPSWQQGVSMASNGGSTSKRNLPDVALIADNVYAISSNGQGSYMGGTSVAAPLWAGFTALMNQQAAAYGKSPVGFINPAIYSLGKSTNYASLFRDVATGNNTSSSSPSKFYAVSGYDLCTGWGTPKGSAFINAMVPPNPVAPFGLTKSQAAAKNFVFSFPTVAGQSYTVEYQNGFGGSWTKLTSVSGTGVSVSVTNAMTRSQRFFRVKSP